jgi:hypothetical protein
MRRIMFFSLGAASGLLFLAVLFMLRSHAPQDPARATAWAAKERFASRHRAVPELPERPGLPTRQAVMEDDLMRLLDQAELAKLADDAVNVHGALREGDTRWEATELRLVDLAYLREERLACAAQHATPITADCLGNIDMVLRRLPGESEAAVVFARGGGSTDAPQEEVACAAYVECLAASRVGSIIPVPPGEDEILAISQRTSFAWASPVLFDPEKVAELIGLREEALAERLERGNVGDFERRSEEQLIEYLHRHHDELQQAEAP